jgi:predicted SAM-dependent methyltransferase
MLVSHFSGSAEWHIRSAGRKIGVCRIKPVHTIRFQQMPVHVCPVCKSEDSLVPFSGRANAICTNCQCMERSRLMWMALRQLKLPSPETRVLHFAPEDGLSRRLYKACRYSAKDFAPEKYRRRPFPVEKFDLCSDTRTLPDASFDLILHNHVLEHLPCRVEDALVELDRILTPGGIHMFSVPIKGSETVEDLSPELTPQERLARFGLEDHMRVFGLDAVLMFKRLWKQEAVLFDFSYSEEALATAGIPIFSVFKPTAHSMFFRRKPV